MPFEFKVSRLNNISNIPGLAVLLGVSEVEIIGQHSDKHGTDKAVGVLSEKLDKRRTARQDTIYEMSKQNVGISMSYNNHD